MRASSWTSSATPEPNRAVLAKVKYILARPQWILTAAVSPNFRGCEAVASQTNLSLPPPLTSTPITQVSSVQPQVGYALHRLAMAVETFLSASQPYRGGNTGLNSPPPFP